MGEFMAGYPDGNTGNLLRDSRLNRKDILFLWEFNHNANYHVFQADLEGGKLATKTNPGHWLKNEGPIWNYWWQIDKDWIKKSADDRASNPLVDRFNLHDAGWVAGTFQWKKGYGFNQTRIDDHTATMKTRAISMFEWRSRMQGLRPFVNYTGGK